MRHAVARRRGAARLTAILRRALPCCLVGALALPGFAAPGAFRVRPGVFLSASVALSLQADGAFLVQELGGSRRASGRYALTPGMLTLVSGQGDVGRTRFPLKCRVVEAFGGFRVVPGQSGCKPFDGLSFRTAN